MHLDELQGRQSAGGLLRQGGVAAAWAVIGSAVGAALVFLAPHLIPTPGAFIPGCGSFVAALYGVGALKPLRRNELVEIGADLRTVNRLLRTGQIDHFEYTGLRKKILKRYK